MEVILTKRGGGKTTQLIRKSAETRGVIVCATMDSVKQVVRSSKEMCLNIPQPITFHHFLQKGSFMRKDIEYYIDDIDRCILNLTQVEISIVTLTKE